LENSQQFDRLEGVNRARHAFGDFIERGKNRLVLEGNSYVENYYRGRMALVLYCNDSSPMKIETAGIISEVGLTGCPKNFFFIVLKADIAELH
jgi:hypothetical protein